jgi:predicted membrane-bound spermidine synthase
VRRCYAEGRSKAAISRYVGTKDSLSSEYNYVRQTLPLGVVRNLVAALRYFKFARIQRAMAIVLGLAITTLGYLVGRISVKSVHIMGDAPSVTALSTVMADLPATLSDAAALTSSSTQDTAEA